MAPIRLLPILFATAFAGWCQGDVVINEFQSSNASTLLDEDGDASDWIELRNRGTEAVDLAGWGLSDRPDEPFKWVFPSLELAAGERLLVWCSGKNRTQPGGAPPSTRLTISPAWCCGCGRKAKATPRVRPPIPGPT